MARGVGTPARRGGGASCVPCVAGGGAAAASSSASDAWASNSLSSASYVLTSRAWRALSVSARDT